MSHHQHSEIFLSLVFFFASNLLLPTELMICSFLPYGVFFSAACVSSYLHFFYQWPLHMSDREQAGLAGEGDGEGRRRGSLMKSVNEAFAKFTKPHWSEESLISRYRSSHFYLILCKA